MENRASKTRSLNIAFVLSPDLLKRLAAILMEASETLEFTVKFADGTNVQYSRVEEIIEQPNSKHRSIISLIAGTAGEGTPSANMVLKAKAKEGEPSVEYTVSGPQRSVVYLSDQLDDWVAAIRQWYSRGFSPGAWIPILIVVIFLPIYAWNHASHFFFSEAVSQGKSESWVQGLSIVLMWIVEYFIFRLFPRGTFTIGRGATRYQFLVSLRWSVLVALLVSFLASILANLLTKR